MVPIPELEEMVQFHAHYLKSRTTPNDLFDSSKGHYIELKDPRDITPEVEMIEREVKK